MCYNIYCNKIYIKYIYNIYCIIIINSNAPPESHRAPGVLLSDHTRVLRRPTPSPSLTISDDARRIHLCRAPQGLIHPS